MPVPPELQAAVLRKVFNYDRTLKGYRPINVLVVHGPAESSVAEELVAAFEETGVSSSAIAPADLPRRIQGAAVVYVAAGVDAATVEALCAANGVLSVTGLPELVLTGKVAIAVGLPGKRPEILVHLKRLKDEKHDIAVSLLNLARVIR